jgi:hypothetical protein
MEDINLQEYELCLEKAVLLISECEISGRINGNG